MRSALISRWRGLASGALRWVIASMLPGILGVMVSVIDMVVQPLTAADRSDNPVSGFRWAGRWWAVVG